MEAGKLRHRITIKRKLVTRDSFGGETVTLSAGDAVWASVEPMRGQEFIETQKAGVTVDTRIRIRYRPGLTTDMVVVWGTHTYDVLAVINVMEARRETQLMVKEVSTHAS